MSINPSSLPAIDLQLLPAFPAHVQGSGPITVSKSGLTYTFGADFRQIIHTTELTPVADYHALLQNVETGSFHRASLADIYANFDPPNGSIGNDKLADMPEATVKGRPAGSGTGAPQDITVSQALDSIGDDVGTLAVRGALGWEALAPGDQWKVLTSMGADAVPQWVDNIPANSTVTDAKVYTPASADDPNAVKSNKIAFLQDGTGAVWRTSQDKMRDQWSVFDGMNASLRDAIRNSEVADADAAEISAAINNVIDDVYNAGGGILHYPAGLYFVTDTQASLTQRLAILGRSKVYHKGAGRGATIIRAADGANCHMFLWRDEEDFGLSGMTLDGNRDNQGAPTTGNDGSILMMVTAARRGAFLDLHLRDSYDYSIGVQVGTAIGMRFEDILIEASGADGIDFKNTLNDSQENWLRRITVRGFGARPTMEQFAGIDLRGIVSLDGAWVEGVGATDSNGVGQVGIRLHSGEGADVSYVGETLGAIRCHVQNARIIGYDGYLAGNEHQIGLHARGRLCSVSNVTIRKVPTGLQIPQEGGAFGQVLVEHCKQGVRSRTGEAAGGVPLATGPDDMTFVGLRVRGCSQVGVNLQGNRSTFLGAVITDNDINVNVSSGATGNRFIGGRIQSPGTTNVSNSGTGTIFDRVVGYRTQNRVISEEFALDSTGVRTLSISHGLDVTPDREDCSLTLSVDAAQEDFRCDAPWVRQTSGSTVSAKIRVSAASATAGLRGRLILDVDASER